MARPLALASVAAMHTRRHAHSLYTGTTYKKGPCVTTPPSASSATVPQLRCIGCTQSCPPVLAPRQSHAAAAAYARVVRPRAHVQQARGAHGEGVEGTQHQPRVGKAVGAEAEALVVAQLRSGSVVATGQWVPVQENDCKSRPWAPRRQVQKAIAIVHKASSGHCVLQERRSRRSGLRHCALQVKHLVQP